MKNVKLFIWIFLFFFCWLPSMAQHGELSEPGMNQMAPGEAGVDHTGPLKIQGSAESDIIQIISTEENRGSGGGNGSFSPMAVPVNNNCTNAITLTVDAACVNGTNKEANVQSGEATACQGSVTKTVWYKFVATAGSLFVEVERTASSGCYLSSAVYSGSCLPSTSLSCEDAASGPNLNIHNLTGLTIGATYFIQVSYTGGSFCGNNSNAGTGADFCIKVGTPRICATCNNPCGALCVYPTQPTVAQVTSTCTPHDLKPRLNAGQSKTLCYTFTAVAANFSLQMIINSVGCGMGGNVTAFNWQLYPSNCSGAIQSGNLSNMNANGLNIGSSYVLCYTWTSACQHNTVYPYIVATSPLPVELLIFDGKLSGKNIQLNWTTASETGNNYFSVQRSADGINFEEIGKVPGAGNSTQMLYYEFTDRSPIKGVNYYRLVQHDYDGNSTSSQLIAIKFLENSFIKVENNPVKDLLQVYVMSENEYAVVLTIVNNLGEPVHKSTRQLTKGVNKFSIPVDRLSNGSYFLKMESQNETSWTRFVKL